MPPISSTLKTPQVTLYNADCLELLPTLPANSIDLILTDPPYFKVKSNSWDNQWETKKEFMVWLDAVLYELWRVLKPNGSLYLFCGSQLQAETELLVGQRFNVLNSLVWSKPSGPHNKCRKADLTRYFPRTERLVFAEHYLSAGSAKGPNDYLLQKSQVRSKVFSPLIDYFKSAREASNVSAKDINAATSTSMTSHWFSSSQWHLPSIDNYSKLQSIMKLERPYKSLQNEYEKLLAIYKQELATLEPLRRTFNVTKHVPFTDSWEYKTVPYYEGKHVCEKPAEMMRDIINASSREGDVVGDFFFGSCVSGTEAVRLGRKFVGCEFEQETFDRATEEFKVD